MPGRHLVLTRAGEAGVGAMNRQTSGRGGGSNSTLHGTPFPLPPAPPLASLLNAAPGQSGPRPPGTQVACLMLLPPTHPLGSWGLRGQFCPWMNPSTCSHVTALKGFPTVTKGASSLSVEKFTFTLLNPNQNAPEKVP